ncbi:mycofactocin-coupled SDR family oxidoreductase [Cryobacterium sp.]|jgi:SDR family mycofactocin-dependent oxidoreductase|uniref:mycofactocin-coupled SDR family oxidoreductase n=1 Tax=Cryobacterium sp. TaxID=1926290 RepID=UPI00261CBF85|nr:mycofactocin-coupled SDR family oxidoreductase [Cryobacterium sp.]MCU1446108.1 family mycofactocin-dependent oxidoreductase [Cryobacterium sp.]
MTGKLEGKVAFITGAARGQGRAHAIKLAQEGADIIAIDLAGPIPLVPYDSSSMEDLQETVRLVEALDRRILFEQVDVRDLDAMRGFVDSSVAELGHLDIVVANAGICIPATWNETTPEMFQTTMDINVTGVWNTVMVGAPHLVTAGGGSIILTSSYAGKKMQPFMVHYTASKHAVTGMTRAFAAELGKHSIRVNSVHPGAVNTPMGSGDMIEAITRTNASNPALAVMGTPFLPVYSAEAEDIANAVAFLASDDARLITSEHLSIDAGSQYF